MAKVTYKIPRLTVLDVREALNKSGAATGVHFLIEPWPTPFSLFRVAKLSSLINSQRLL